MRERLEKLERQFRRAEPHPGHPTLYSEVEPWCHACSPNVAWSELRWLVRVAQAAQTVHYTTCNHWCIGCRQVWPCHVAKALADGAGNEEEAPSA